MSKIGFKLHMVLRSSVPPVRKYESCHSELSFCAPNAKKLQIVIVLFNCSAQSRIEQTVLPEFDLLYIKISRRFIVRYF